jgi:hypothetical protein
VEKALAAARIVPAEATVLVEVGLVLVAEGPVVVLVLAEAAVVPVGVVAEEEAALVAVAEGVEGKHLK